MYRSSDGRFWAGRRAFRLKHNSTVESRVDRAYRRVAKIEARLRARGCVVEDGEVTKRGKHCRRDWIERMLEKLDEADASVDEELIRHLSILLA